MSEEQKPAETPAEEKKDAEGEGVDKYYCTKCGKVFYSADWTVYCPNGCGSGCVRRY